MQSNTTYYTIRNDSNAKDPVYWIPDTAKITDKQFQEEYEHSHPLIFGDKNLPAITLGVLNESTDPDTNEPYNDPASWIFGCDIHGDCVFKVAGGDEWRVHFLHAFWKKLEARNWEEWRWGPGINQFYTAGHWSYKCYFCNDSMLGPDESFEIRIKGNLKSAESDEWKILLKQKISKKTGQPYGSINLDDAIMMCCDEQWHKRRRTIVYNLYPESNPEPKKHKYDLDVQPEQVPPMLMTDIFLALYSSGTDTKELEKKVQQYCTEEWQCMCRSPVGEIYEIRMNCLKTDVGGEKFHQVLKEKINQKCGAPVSRIQLKLACTNDSYFTRKYDFELSPQSK